jgi:hypothetical protein
MYRQSLIIDLVEGTLAFQTHLCELALTDCQHLGRHIATNQRVTFLHVRPDYLGHESCPSPEVKTDYRVLPPHESLCRVLPEEWLGLQYLIVPRVIVSVFEIMIDLVYPVHQPRIQLLQYPSR